MLPNKQTKRNLAILLMAAVMVGLTMTAWAKKPDKPGGGKGGGGGGGGDGGPVGTGTIYYASGGLWSMNPDGTGKTLMDEPGGAASIARHPAGGDRWFLQVRGVDEFYPITTFPPEYWNYEWREGDLETVGFTGDPDPAGAWTISYTIMIDSIGGEGEPDTFSWHAHSSLFGDTPDITVGDITGLDQELDLIINEATIPFALTIKFGSTTGHNVNDWWEIYVRKTQRSELFAVREDGQSEVQLTDDPTVQIWSPNGYLQPDLRWATRYDGVGEVVDGKVSYLAQRWDTEEDVVVEGSEGLYAVEITWDDGTPSATDPAMLPVSIPMGPYDWSPEGDRIVYTGPGLGIWVVNADMGGPGDLLCGGWSPRWSPVLDGGTTLIAFRVGRWEDPAEIKTISPNGGIPTTVVAVGKNRTIRGDLMHWSPMGTHLVYTVVQSKACSGCQYNDSYDVYRVGADGSSPTNLTSGIKDNCFSVGWRD